MEALTTERLRGVLSSNPKKAIADASLTPAGVMVLVYPKDGEHCVLLNKRTDKVEHHRGEISFPGGAKDPGDATLLHTALRETHEEMGITPESVQVLGELDDVPTTTRFLVSPFVGTIAYPYDFRPSKAEVAEVLEVPLALLASADSVRDEVRVTDSGLAYAPTYAYNGHLIYGATARVLRRFLELLDTPS